MKFVNFVAACFTVSQFQVIFSVIMDPPCPELSLLFGKVRLRSRGRVAKFRCDASYQLYGDKFITCIRGTWDANPPLCIRNDCPQLSKNPENGYWIDDYRGASYTLMCNSGYVLRGTRTIYCHRRKWNDAIPFCEKIHMSCDFEMEDLCGWTQDMDSNFTWTRHNNATPSNHIGTGPSFDHSLGQGSGGHYMYIESSSPRAENDTARLFSPVYESILSQDACFIFWYHMHGATIGDLNVYQTLQPEKTKSIKIFHKSGEQGNQWFMGIANLTTVNKPFQIVLEAVRGRSYSSDIAVDDVKLSGREECLNVTLEALTLLFTQTTLRLPTSTADIGITTPRTLRPYATYLPPPPLPALPPLPPTPYLPPTTTSSTPTPHFLEVSVHSESFQSSTFDNATTYIPPYNTGQFSSPEYVTNFTLSPMLSISAQKKSAVTSQNTSTASTSKRLTVDTKENTQRKESHLVTTSTPLFISLNTNNVRQYHSTQQQFRIRASTIYVDGKKQSTLTERYFPLKISTSKYEYPKTNKTTQVIIQTSTSPTYHTRRETTTRSYFLPTISTVRNDDKMPNVSTQSYHPAQTFVTLKNGIISSGKKGNLTTVEPSTINRESNAAAKVSHVSSIAGVAGGIAGVAVIAGLLVFVLSRRVTRFKKQNDMSEDSDVRFLTSDEELDFSLARPIDDL